MGHIGQTHLGHLCLLKVCYYSNACFYYITRDGKFEGDLEDMIYIFLLFGVTVHLNIIPIFFYVSWIIEYCV